MSLNQEKVVKSTWECDWCEHELITESEKLPEDWIVGDGCDDNGEHFCNDECQGLSREAWDDSFEAGMDARSQYYTEEKQKWQTLNYDKIASKQTIGHD